MGKHIDIILSNPPYKMGNEITRAIVDNVDFDVFINLMPCRCYKAKNLFKDVNYIEPTAEGFDDAVVGDSLTIAILEKDAARYSNFDELENDKRDSQFQEYYMLNMSCPKKYPNQLRPKVTDGDTLNNDTTFVVGKRVCKDGVHRTQNTYDYKFNILKTINHTALPIDGDDFDIWIMQFVTKSEKDNFMRFWYKNPLMNNLIKGLKKTGGSPDVAIPRINWSKSDRDYEHATLEDVMNWLREDNNL